MGRQGGDLAGLIVLKSFGYYGTVGDQVNETRGAVNRLWVCGFDGSISTRKANILSAGVPVTLDVSACLYPASSKPYGERTDADVAALDRIVPDARDRLLAMQRDLGEAWDYVDSIVLIDEPNLSAHAKSEDTLKQAAKLIRGLWPGKKLAVIYYTGKPLVGLGLFDWVGFDRYKDGDKVLWDWWPKWLRWLMKWGWAKHMQRQLRPDQELILVPGGGEQHFPSPTISKWVKYAQRLDRPVHMICFLWRAPRYADDSMVGIVSRADLAADYLAAGREFVA